jgi:hypothetical protein
MFRKQYAEKEELFEAVWEKSKEGLTPNECYQWVMRQAMDFVVGTAMTPKVIINFLSRRRLREGYGPASSQKHTQNVLDLLEKEKTEEGLYYSAACNDEGTLLSLFWATHYQISRWETLNDCSIFDTTYKCSIDDMKLHLLVAVNEHGSTEILAQALTKHEALTEYYWIFKELSFACQVENVDGRPRVSGTLV